MSHSRTIKIFDTTLRDGEQSPGCSMQLGEKLALASQLERLGVDVIEAGFAVASKGDFEAVKAISSKVTQATVASLARALKGDIDIAYEALKEAHAPRIHTFLATSPIHMAYKLKKTPEQVIYQVAQMVKYAKTKIADVEFSAEDATRSDINFLSRVIDEAILAGATTINIPDTVGYTTPESYAHFIKALLEQSKHLYRVDLSVHCHNDLGLAVANSLSAINAGATQIECTINGIGERAGNAALEEVVMAMNTRRDFYMAKTRIVATEIAKTSRLVSSIIGVPPSPTKPIVGANAFSHESGIHQHGVLENPTTYEIMSPESVGLAKQQMVLGKHSGKHGFLSRVKELGFEMSEVQLNQAFESFKKLADKKKAIYDEDIIGLIKSDMDNNVKGYFELVDFTINSSSSTQATATIHLKDQEDNPLSGVSLGDGPIDAAYNAINSIVRAHHGTCTLNVSLESYGIRALTQGDDAQGEASVMLKSRSHTFSATGISTDILEASILAYINAINKHIFTANAAEGGLYFENTTHDHDTKNIGCPCGS